MRLGWIIALAAFLCADPAAADITARYRQSNGEPDMVLQVNERGESRMAATEATYVSKDGVTYMIIGDGEGRFVTRLDDFLALMDELLRASGQATPTADPGHATISDAGNETVAGRPGRLLRIADSRAPSDTIDIVISSDADLAPLREAINRHLAAFFDTMGRSTPWLADAIREVMSRGALLRLGPLFQLESIAAEPLPAALFELPSPPLSRAALGQRLRTQAAH